MTTLFTSPAPMSQTLAATRGPVALWALWATQVVLAGMFMLSGGMKLAGLPLAVAMFDAVGIGQWFRYATGTIEVVAAAALLVPFLSPFGALVMVPTMVGAIATHLFIIGGSAMPATVLLIGSLAVVWARRDQLAGAWSRLH